MKNAIYPGEPGDILKRAVYPGSFDPITNGHIDILKRALEIFDHVAVVVAINPSKNYLFTTNERVTMIWEALKVGVPDFLGRVSVNSYSGLTVEFAHSRANVKSIVRGLRAVTDFETEFQLALINRNLAPDIDTVFFMTDKEHIFFSSSAVKGIAMYDGDVSNMVCPFVESQVMRKMFK